MKYFNQNATYFLPHPHPLVGGIIALGLSERGTRNFTLDFCGAACNLGEIDGEGLTNRNLRVMFWNNSSGVFIGNPLFVLKATSFFRRK